MNECKGGYALCVAPLAIHTPTTRLNAPVSRFGGGA
jgi:hypothetical protein